MARARAKKKSRAEAKKKIPAEYIVFWKLRKFKKHIFTLYSLLFFTWVIMITSFIETTGSIVISIKAIFIGLILGVLLAAMINHFN